MTPASIHSSAQARPGGRWRSLLTGTAAGRWLPPFLMLSLTLFVIDADSPSAADRALAERHAATLSKAGDANSGQQVVPRQDLRRELREHNRSWRQGGVREHRPAGADAGTRHAAERQLLHQQLRQIAREPALRGGAEPHH